MRVLFTSWAWPSHLHAMVPLAWACRTAGHQVLVACQPGLVDEVRRTGLPHAVVGSDVDSAAMVAGYLLPSRRFPAPPVPAATEPSGVRIPRALQMFLANADAMADDIVRLARGWRPDLVVHDPTAWAGFLAAAAAEVPAVRHLYGADLLHRARHLLPGLLDPVARRCRLTELDLHGDRLGAVTLDPFPLSLQLHDEATRIGVRYVPSSAFTAVPDLPRRRRPRVCVSWGTTIARMGHGRMLTGEVLRALHRLDVELLALVTRDQHGQLGPVPPGVTVVEDTALHAVLADCDVLVAHGGAGTLLTGLAAGLPLLMVPQLPDHDAHARRVEAAGAGTVLAVDDASPRRLCSAVTALLDDPGPAVAARRIATEIAAQPPPAAVVDDLARIASATRTAPANRRESPDRPRNDLSSPHHRR